VNCTLLCLLYSFSSHFLLKRILSWNCRGAGGAPFTRALRNYISANGPEIQLILEPRISGERADAICAKFPRYAKSRVDARGFAGGIWLWWLSDRLNLSVEISHSQFIHCKISRDAFPLWWLTAVYACPQPSGRAGLWTDLRRLAGQIAEPWLCLGDLFEIASLCEKALTAQSSEG
jgi:hypothetical protein